MNSDMLLSMQLPLKVFATYHQFNALNEDDMQCGDLNDMDMRSLGLQDISAKVDPYRLIAFESQPFILDDSGFNPQYPAGRAISHYECANILFDEMKELSHSFAFGDYGEIIIDLIDHFHYKQGQDYQSLLLDKAYTQIIEGIGTNETLMKITNEIDSHLIRRSNVLFNLNDLQSLRFIINKTVLPKFNRWEDRYNGLGISVHDIYAQEIEIVNLHRYAQSWDAMLYFKAQDHFGLGREDINKSLYRCFRFFRIWFFLQRHERFAFKPFFTNFSAHVHTRGGM
ncbi:DUF3289 family protein [Buttiauxella sp. WJP83]|uniref:DUF3289 family protein n=1 Tax=Buttiauxella sp. WJP83 TaxID=2986951 RepID=UPI0022DCEEFA|nr:DUF3289 family protein [Buttiauxella sp. WJP83]WBM71181.1 DUF3289 family protein [Buttiauxella sp. WJP83]